MAFATALAIGAAVAGTALSAYGQYSQGKAAEAEGEYNAQVAERNAKAARLKSGFDQLRQLRRGAQIKGTLRARLGKSGALMDEGAPLAAQAAQAFELELENALIGYEGMNAESQHQSQAVGFRMQGSNARSASRIGVGTSLLNGFTNMYQAGMIGSPSAAGPKG